MLSSFKSIAEKSFKTEKLSIYDSIPLNREFIRDIIFRNISLIRNGRKYLIDISVNQEEVNTKNLREFYYSSAIEDIGDLSTLCGYEDHDFKGLTVEYGKTYTDKTFSKKELPGVNFRDLYKMGFTNILVKDLEISEFSKYPANLVKNNNLDLPKEIKTELPANLVFREKSEVKYVVINGFLYSLENFSGNIKNGLIY